MEQEQIYQWIPQKLWWLVSTYLANRIDRSQVLNDRHGQDLHGGQPVSTDLFGPANTLGTDNRREKNEESKFIGLENYESPKNNDQSSDESELLDHSNLRNFDEVQRTLEAQSQKDVESLQKERLMFEVLNKDSARSNKKKKAIKLSSSRESQKRSHRVTSKTNSKFDPHPRSMSSKRNPKNIKFSKDASGRSKRMQVSKEQPRSNQAKKEHLSQKRKIEMFENQIKAFKQLASIQKVSGSMTFLTDKISTKKKAKKKSRLSTLNMSATPKKISTPLFGFKRKPFNKKATGLFGNNFLSQNPQTSLTNYNMTPKNAKREKDINQFFIDFSLTKTPKDNKERGSSKKALKTGPTFNP
jgi:hypothetical protein